MSACRIRRDRGCIARSPKDGDPAGSRVDISDSDAVATFDLDCRHRWSAQKNSKGEFASGIEGRFP